MRSVCSTAALAILFLFNSIEVLRADVSPPPNTSPWVNINDSDNQDPPQKGTWFMQMNGDLDFPTGNLAQAVDQGWGGEISIGYHLPRDFEIGIELGYDTYSEKNGAFTGTWNVTPLVVKLAYVIGKGSVQPYLFLAGGIAFNSKHADLGALPGNALEADFLGEAGLGLSFAISGASCVFFQTKMELDNTSAGYAADQPTILMPLNLGINFPLN